MFIFGLCFASFCIHISQLHSYPHHKSYYQYSGTLFVLHCISAAFFTFTFIILSSHTYAMIFVQKENENAVINGVLAKDSSF